MRVDADDPEQWLMKDEEILELITTCADVNSTKINDSVSLSHLNFLDGYLEDPYLRLLDRIAGGGDRTRERPLRREA